jgi:hypothetical protein
MMADLESLTAMQIKRALATKYSEFIYERREKVGTYFPESPFKNKMHTFFICTICGSAKKHEEDAINHIREDHYKELKKVMEIPIPIIKHKHPLKPGRTRSLFFVILNFLRNFLVKK